MGVTSGTPVVQRIFSLPLAADSLFRLLWSSCHSNGSRWECFTNQHHSQSDGRHRVFVIGPTSRGCPEKFGRIRIRFRMSDLHGRHVRSTWAGVCRLEHG